MHKEIRRIDEQGKFVQVTTCDSRFYGKLIPGESGIEEFIWRPSVTWICDYYFKGPQLIAFFKKNGEESDQIKRLAGDRGYKVHLAVGQLNAGFPVRGISCGEKKCDLFLNPTNGREEELSLEEYTGVLSYVEWWETEGRKFFKVIGFEYTIWPDPVECSERTGYPERVFNYAGTVDIKVEQIVDRSVIVAAGYKNWTGDKGSTGIIDSKTSLDIWPTMEMQVSAYKVAEKADWAAILQLNYRRNKTKLWKLTQIEDRFALFCSTQRIWEHETAGEAPLQRDFPLEVRLSKQADPAVSDHEVAVEVKPKKRRES